MSDEARDCIKQQAVVFKETRATRTAVSDDNDSNIDVADQQITRFELFLTFIDYVSNIYRGETNCHDLVSHRSFAAELLAVFDRNFVQAHDIHGQVQTMAMSESRSSALRHYYDASAFAERHPKVEIEQIFKTLRDQRRVFAYFGGQGSDNPECLNNLRKLYDRYRPLLHDLFQAANTLLHELSTDSYSTAFFNSDNIRLTEWLDNPSTAPDTRKLSLAPYSFPLIGLASLANYCVLCKAANLSPGDVRGMLKGVTGHSQGIIIAAAVSAAYDWESFYDSAKFALELLFWIGLESHREAPQNKLSSKIMKETISAGFGEPSCMLSVRGLKKASLLMELSAVDAELGSAENVELALENTSDSFVLAGPAAILRAVALRLERLSASPGLDQSRVPYDQRRKEIYLQFMPISAPFHSSYLKHVPDRVFQRMQDSRFKLGELKVPVYGTSNGQNLKSGGTDIIEALVSMITTEAVNWPLATTFLGATHILDLGPGRLHSLMSSVKEGTGARLFAAGGGQSAEVGSLADAFGHGGATSLSSWSEKHGPRLRRKESVESVDTSFSRLLGVPPIMVAGMTPTTVSWRFVSAISTACYHAELSGGGYFSPDAFENAILRLSDCLSGSRGITVNLIYVNPRAMAWQVALLKDLISQGVPIEGMTIGAGVPSLDVACDYIDTIGLKHIGFKPGSKSAIQQVISIAKARPRFPILLQWTGGRGGGRFYKCLY
jgi:fatty acid synthase subunit beta